MRPRSVGPVARGEVGQVWRLEAAAGVFAVKEPFDPTDDGWAEGFQEAAAFQDTARGAGVNSPGVVRTPSGEVVAWFDRSPVRVYEWVDMAPADGGIDPAAVGSMLARLHRCGFEGRVGTHWWYRTPVGADRWDELVDGTARAGAPFAADLRAMRDELVALEQVMEDPPVVQTCHRDVWADNVRATSAGSLVVIDWEGMGLADPSGELAMVLFEFAHADADRAHAVGRGLPGRWRPRAASTTSARSRWSAPSSDTSSPGSARGGSRRRRRIPSAPVSCRGSPSSSTSRTPASCTGRSSTPSADLSTRLTTAPELVPTLDPWPTAR